MFVSGKCIRDKIDNTLVALGRPRPFIIHTKNAYSFFVSFLAKNHFENQIKSHLHKNVKNVHQEYTLGREYNIMDDD